MALSLKDWWQMFIISNWETPPMTYLVSVSPWSGKEKYLLGIRQDPASKDQTKWQPVAPNPRWPQLWMDGRCRCRLKTAACSLGTGWEEINHTASCFSLQPDLLPFQQNTCIALSQMASSPSQHPVVYWSEHQGLWPWEGNAFLSSLGFYDIFFCWMIS